VPFGENDFTNLIIAKEMVDDDLIRMSTSGHATKNASTAMSMILLPPDIRWHKLFYSFDSSNPFLSGSVLKPVSKVKTIHS
jgi:hypothetical protein